MTGKSLVTAKQQRDKFLLEFKAACYDLEGEVTPEGGRAANVRRIKMKMKEVKSTYEDCLEAQSQVYGLEKTSGAEESNWNWVVTNLKRPFNEVMNKAEDLLETLEQPADPEAETKAELLDAKRSTKLDLSCFEAKLKAEIEGAQEVFGETNIWLKDNHAALTSQIEEVGRELNEKHIVMHRNYRKYLDDTEGQTEETRFGTCRGVRHVSGGQAGDVQQSVHQPNQESRFRMAAMAKEK